jgi:predicted transcriptional regulator
MNSGQKIPPFDIEQPRPETRKNMLTQAPILDIKTAKGRRSALEVMMDIMTAAAHGCTGPTTIMYRSNTSWIILKKNLTSLVASGFMLESRDGVRSSYSVTAKGTAVLQEYLNIVYLTTHQSTTFP